MFYFNNYNFQQNQLLDIFGLPDPVIVFNQKELISQVNQTKDHELNYFVNRFGGLCELICNRILLDGLLDVGIRKDFLQKKVTLKKLNKSKIRNSHIIKIHSIFRKILAYIFKIYADNLFNYNEQRNLVLSNGEINKELIKQKFSSIKQGEVIKFEVFNIKFFNAQGHSMLIKKTGNNEFIFFDPNFGEYRELSFDSLFYKMNKALRDCGGNEILLIRGKDYLKRMKSLF